MLEKVKKLTIWILHSWKKSSSPLKLLVFFSVLFVICLPVIALQTPTNHITHAADGVLPVTGTISSPPDSVTPPPDSYAPSQTIFDPAAATPVKSGLVVVALTNSSGTPMCLSDKNGGTANKNPIVINPCSRTDSTENWTLYTDNTIRFSGKCLDDLGAHTTNGNGIDLYTCNGTNAQIWTRGANAEKSLNDLESKVASAKCLDVFGSATGNNSTVDLWDCNGTNGQVWGWSTSGKINPGGSTRFANCHGSIVGGNFCYYWVIGAQKNNGHFTAKGISADILQGMPTIGNNEGNTHSDGEIYVASDSGAQAIEIGWISTDSKPNPQLFVTTWVNHQFSGYNDASGFVQLANSPQKINADVTAHVSANYKLLFTNNQWQLWYNKTDEVGYFPESIWTSKGAKFTSFESDQIYGEVAATPYTVSIIQMGNGNLGTADNGAGIFNYTLYNSTTPANFGTFSEPSGGGAMHYAYGGTTTTSYRYGGPGYTGY